MNTPGSYKYNDHTYILIQDLNLVRMKKKKERKDMKRVKSFSLKSASSDFFVDFLFYFRAIFSAEVLILKIS